MWSFTILCCSCVIGSFCFKNGALDRLEEHNQTLFFGFCWSMASDSDSFDYRSSQDSSHLDDLIDRFEYLRSVKTGRKRRKSMGWSFSVKNVKSNKFLLQQSCLSEEIRTRQRRSVGPSQVIDRQLDCDAEFLNKMANDDSSNRIQGKSFENLADFRRDFYLAKHQLIKSSLKDQPDLQITNVRLAPIDESVQNKFLEQLNQVSSHPPQLVYHGTQLANFESILRFGLLVPNRCHPNNSDAPLITVKNGQAHGMGIYSSLTASFSVLYLKSTNTLLACATLPQRDKRGNISNLHGNILVLTKESRIIPMFLVDFKRSNVGQKNFPLFRPPPMEIVEPIVKE